MNYSRRTANAVQLYECSETRMNKGQNRANCREEACELAPNGQLPDMSYFRGSGAEIRRTVDRGSRFVLQIGNSPVSGSFAAAQRKKPIFHRGNIPDQAYSANFQALALKLARKNKGSVRRMDKGSCSQNVDNRMVKLAQMTKSLVSAAFVLGSRKLPLPRYVKSRMSDALRYKAD